VVPESGLRTDETGSAAQFSVVLQRAPSANVAVDIASSNPAEGIVDVSNLTFTPNNWDQPQFVTVTGVDDSILDGDVPYTVITGAAVSSDPAYNGLEVADVTLVNIDDEGGPIDYVAYWKMDEGAGVFTEDTSIYGHTGTLNGGLHTTGWTENTPPTQYPNEFALEFDGTNDYVAFPAGGSLNIVSNAVSVSLWTKLDRLPSALGAYSYAGLFDSVEDAYVIYEDKVTNELRFKVTDANGTAERPGIPAANLDTASWHHIVGVYDGNLGTASIYLDGVLQDTHVNPALIDNVKTGQVAAIGRNGAESRYYFDGSIDDVRVYPRALSGTEIVTLFGNFAQIAGGGSQPGGHDLVGAVVADWLNASLEPDRLRPATNRSDELRSSALTDSSGDDWQWRIGESPEAPQRNASSSAQDDKEVDEFFDWLGGEGEGND
jgi:hypothetical protein